MESSREIKKESEQQTEFTHCYWRENRIWGVGLIWEYFMIK